MRDRTDYADMIGEHNRPWAIYYAPEGCYAAALEVEGRNGEGAAA